MILASVRLCRFCNCYYPVTANEVAAQTASTGIIVHDTCVEPAIIEWLLHATAGTDTTPARGSVAIIPANKVAAGLWQGTNS
jgi:hypothetical protein